VKSSNVQCDNDKPFSSGGVTLPTTHLASINLKKRISHIKFYTQSKTRSLTAINRSLYTKSSFVLRRSAD